MVRALFGLFISVFIFFTFSSFHRGYHPSAVKLRTIVIDPGHGGLYPGTRGLISAEKDVTLEISLRLGEAIKTKFPNTKVVFRLPLFRLIIDKDATKGRGVIPEVEAKPSVEDIRKGIDFKMEKVKELIREKEAKDKL